MRSVFAVLIAVITLCATLSATENEEISHRLNDSAMVFSEIMASPDKAIPEDLLKRAQCIVIVPGEKEAAFIAGAKFGKGFLSCRTNGGTAWSAPAAIRVEGGSFGLQIGGNETDLVLLVMNERGENRLLSNQFTLGVDAQVAAGPVGRSTGADTDAAMTAEILSWSRSRGIFAGAALRGATLRQDTEENEALYGRRVDNREVVKEGIAPPLAADKLLSLLERYSPQRKS